MGLFNCCSNMFYSLVTLVLLNTLTVAVQGSDKKKKVFLLKTKDKKDKRDNGDYFQQFNILDHFFKKSSTTEKTNMIKSEGFGTSTNLNILANFFGSKWQTTEKVIVTMASKSCECGKAAITSGQEISGGDQAQEFQFPWLVRLVGGCPNDVCGGALVSHRIVLTAFHCTIDNSLDPHSTKPCDHSDKKRLAILGDIRVDLDYIDKNEYKIPVVDVKVPPNAGLTRGDHES